MVLKGISLNFVTLKTDTQKLTPILCFYVKQNPSYNKISKSLMHRANILDFLILSGIPWFVNVDPVRNEFSILKTFYINLIIYINGNICGIDMKVFLSVFSCYDTTRLILRIKELALIIIS